MDSAVLVVLQLFFYYTIPLGPRPLEWNTPYNNRGVTVITNT